MIVSILGGTGEQGPGMALRWAKAGVEVIIGSRQQVRAEATAAELNRELGQPLIKGMTNPEAAAAAAVVALTVPFSAHRSTLESVQEYLQGKVLIDVCVPLDPENESAVATRDEPNDRNGPVTRPSTCTSIDQAASNPRSSRCR